MKNVYPATRPAWLEQDKSETLIIYGTSFVVAAFGAFGGLLSGWLLKPLIKSEDLRRGTWSLIELTVLTFLCVLMLRIYRRLRIGCYPTTFLYCFDLPETSNPSGKSQVVGYCHVKPVMGSGDIEVVGASFFWEDSQLNTDTRVGFKSVQVRGSKHGDENTCDIWFNINAEDALKRHYHHGLLRFRLDQTSGLKKNGDHDVYAGYLESTRKEAEIENVEVRSKGYAEFHSRGDLRDLDIESVLRQRGDSLLVNLQSMLTAKPTPTLWEGANIMQLQQKNFWGHEIPRPQSVVLNQQLKPFIDGLLSKMLSLVGLQESAIRKFKGLALSKAQLNVDDTRVAYERGLKAGLVGQTRISKFNETLYDRAKIIKGQIEPFLEGDSLLDIGCGNGMIANLVRDHFKKVQLLDVVQYVPPTLGLPFKLYKEGEQLPVNGPFDTVLLLTVLHHSYNPVELLKLAWNVTKKNLIIIESVVGIRHLEPGVRYELVDSSDENQIAYAAFIDWFYNRVLHDDVPVPYNFTTPEKWISVFAAEKMRLDKVEHLGQDIEIGPEYHILFVLKKE